MHDEMQILFSPRTFFFCRFLLRTLRGLRASESSTKKGGLFSVESMTPAAAYDLPRARSEKKREAHPSDGHHSQRLPPLKASGHTSSTIIVGPDGTTSETTEPTRMLDMPDI